MPRIRHIGGHGSILTAGKGGRVLGSRALVSYWYGYGNGAANALVEITKPLDIQEGDILLGCLFGNRSTVSSIASRPSGFTNLGFVASSDRQMALDMKIATASEPASYSWTWADNVGSIGAIAVYRIKDFQNAKVVSSFYSSSSSANIVIPSVNAPEPGVLASFFGAKRNTLAESVTPPAGMREVMYNPNASYMLGIYDDVAAPAGNTGTRTFGMAGASPCLGIQIQMR